MDDWPQPANETIIMYLLTETVRNMTGGRLDPFMPADMRQNTSLFDA